ncbi:MAG: bifunctional UDP-sugar hydrolase/5'-nucleotidase, partial [Myxococcota bacterium]|nr:bifunctional UDP-sugar hydrolase/5'-nucleotidase [Myxococcota bacterium]
MCTCSAAVVLLSVLGCRSPRVSTDSPEGTLWIAHTNDQHTHYLPTRAPWIQGEPDIGGVVALEAYLRALRQGPGAGPVLYLDGGDLLTGTPLMDLEVRGVRGGAMLEFLEFEECDAWVLGNHEFDMGFDNAAAMVAASEVPVLSANVKAAGGGPAFPELLDSTTLSAGGMTVGVFGLTTPSLDHLVGPDDFSRLSMVPWLDAARRQVELLEEQVDIVVALTHIGIDADRMLAREVPGIDLVVGGHSHTALQQPVQEGSTWIVQAGSYVRQLGVLQLRVEDGEIVDLQGDLVDLVAPLPIAPDPELVSLVDHYTAELDRTYDRVVGEVRHTMTRDRESESPLGRWAADVVREALGADIGIYNSGGIRSDLEEGPLTYRDLYE